MLPTLLRVRRRSDNSCLDPPGAMFRPPGCTDSMYVQYGTLCKLLCGCREHRDLNSETEEYLFTCYSSGEKVRCRNRWPWRVVRISRSGLSVGRGRPLAAWVPRNSTSEDAHKRKLVQNALGEKVRCLLLWPYRTRSRPNIRRHADIWLPTQVSGPTPEIGPNMFC